MVISLYKSSLKSLDSKKPTERNFKHQLIKHHPPHECHLYFSANQQAIKQFIPLLVIEA